MKIFLSHSSKDKALVRAIQRYFPSHIKTWIDEEDLLVGENIEDSIRKAIIDDSDFVIVFIGKDAIYSSWVKRELEWALEKENKIGRLFILPVLLDDVWDKIEPKVFQKRSYIKCFNQSEDTIKLVVKKLIDNIFAWLSKNLDMINESKINELQQSVPISFCKIGIPLLRGKTIGTVSEKPSSNFPFKINCIKYMDFNNLDPIIDVVIINYQDKPILLNSLGIEIITVAQTWFLAGIIEAYPVKISAICNIYMPNIWQELVNKGKLPSKIETILDVKDNMEPQEINRRIIVDFPDPIYLNSNAPYRYVLVLRKYIQNMPDYSIIKLLVGTNKGIISSKPIFIFVPAHIMHATTKEEIEKDKMAKEIEEKADYFFRNGNLLQAGTLLNDALNIYKNIEENKQNIARIQHNLGIIYLKQKEFIKAEKLLKAAIPIMVKYSGADTYQTSRLYDDLIELYRIQGKSNEMNKLLKNNPIRYSETGEPKISKEVSKLLKNLENISKYDEAIEISMKILIAAEKYFGETHEIVTYWLNRIGVLHYNNKSYRHATALFKNAVEIKEMKSSKDDPELAQYLCNLATALREQKLLLEAKPLYEKAISILEKNHDNEFINFVKKAYSNLLSQL